MSLTKQIEDWSSKHNPKWLAFFRVILGILIFMRGVSFLTNEDQFQQIIEASKLQVFAVPLSEMIPWIHIVGGFLIIIGVITRIACFIQIPILLGAIVFINFKGDLFTMGTAFSYSAIVLLLLIVFFIEGGGPLTLINYIKNTDRD
jgi:putative oxidoreductase